MPLPHYRPRCVHLVTIGRDRLGQPSRPRPYVCVSRRTTWAPRRGFVGFWGVSRGGIACPMYLVSHRGDGGCCGVGLAYFRLSVWTDCIMRNWNGPTSVRSLCRSAVGMASTKDSGMSSLTQSHSSWLSAACSHWCVYGAQSVHLLRHRSQKSLQAGQ